MAMMFAWHQNDGEGGLTAEDLVNRLPENDGSIVLHDTILSRIRVGNAFRERVLS